MVRVLFAILFFGMLAMLGVWGWHSHSLWSLLIIIPLGWLIGRALAEDGL